LVDRGVSGPAGENAIIVVNELVTNAVLHGSGEIELRAGVEGDALFIQVTTDLAPTNGPDPEQAKPGNARGSVGRVGAFCDAVEIRDERTGRRHVVCTIALRSPD
jgi:two-component sensor histidine kinase